MSSLGSLSYPKVDISRGRVDRDTGGTVGVRGTIMAPRAQPRRTVGTAGGWCDAEKDPSP